MLKLREAIVVEGRYDKIALEPLVDTAVFTTDGFGIFRDREKMALLRAVAEKRGLIVFTDADGAGLVIRNRLRSCIDARYLRHAYIPALPGRERRKDRPSKEGTLGVEGMSPKVILEALRRAGTPVEESDADPVSKADLYAMGLSGGRGSAEERRRLQRALGLPSNLSANALLEAVNSLYTREEFLSAAQALQKDGGEVSREDDAGGVALQLGGETI